MKQKTKIGNRLLFGNGRSTGLMYTYCKHGSATGRDIYHKYDFCEFQSIEEILKQPQREQNKLLGGSLNRPGFHRVKHSLKSSIRHNLKKEMMDELQEHYALLDEEATKEAEKAMRLFAEGWLRYEIESREKQALDAYSRKLGRDNVYETDSQLKHFTEELSWDILTRRNHVDEPEDLTGEYTKVDEVIKNMLWEDHDRDQEMKVLRERVDLGYEMVNYMVHLADQQSLLDEEHRMDEEWLKVKAGIDRKNVTRKSRKSRRRA